MSAIGEQIKKYRNQKKYTQEKLGNLIGVTTQAVSKWERGGTPDAEVLPKLADALGVSIDALFGREEQDLHLLLTKKLSKLPADEAYYSAFEICWLMMIGLIGDEKVGKCCQCESVANYQYQYPIETGNIPTGSGRVEGQVRQA